MYPPCPARLARKISRISTLIVLMLVVFAIQLSVTCSHAVDLPAKAGVTVIEAANGKEALEVYQKNTSEITMVITDMGMPVMDGYELFGKLKKLDPQLPIIISSGFGDNDIASRIPREALAGMLNKPYNFDQLLEVLKGVVERAKPANA